MKKCWIFLMCLFCFSLTYSYGEISFKKQREKEIKEAEAKKNEVTETKNDTSTKNYKKTTITNKEKHFRKKILDTAFTKMGTPYVWGANGNGAYDCSSYVQFVYKKALNLDLPRVSYQQADSGQKVLLSQLKAGDLVAFDTLGKNRVSHVGIYIGDNQFIHASSGYKKVVISELEGYYAKKFKYGVKII